MTEADPLFLVLFADIGPPTVAAKKRLRGAAPSAKAIRRRRRLRPSCAIRANACNR